MPLTLYFHPLSSYCHKALIGLYENGVAFDKRMINLGDVADRAELAVHWPLCKFPMLHDDVRDRDVPEATIIIEYIDCLFPRRATTDPGRPRRGARRAAMGSHLRQLRARADAGARRRSHGGREGRHGA